MELTRTPKLAPYLRVHDAPGLIAFIERGLGGTTSYRELDNEGRIRHAEIRLSDGLVMLAETPPDRPPLTSMLHLYVSDADAAIDRAVAAGATIVRAASDAPDGDRRGGVRDRWGHEWWFTRPPG